MKEGETEAKLYEEFTDFCNDESKETQFAIKTGKGASERASAAIADETAKIGAAEAKIDELSTTIATNEKDLAAATEIREKARLRFHCRRILDTGCCNENRSHREGCLL